MRFDVITVFPEAFPSYLKTSMLKRAQAQHLIDVRIHNLRDFAAGRHKSVDEKSYGGGPGMVLKIEPIIKALNSILRISKSQFSISKQKKVKIILFSAGGKQFSSKMAAEWARKYDRIVMIAGHYEGVDERIESVIGNLNLKIENLSIGPYVLTGGELPAMVVIDALSRHIHGVLGKAASLEEKRYGIGVPVYTRPEIFHWKGKTYRVPKVLLSGDHARIEEWRRRNKK